MNTKLLYLPPNLPKPPEEIRDAAHYCLHRTMVGRGLWQTRDANNRYTTFTPLSSTYLRQVVPNYNHGLEWLHDQKVMYSDNWFIVGEKCRGYKWANDYRNITRVPASPKLSKRLTALSRQTFRQYTIAQRHLISWLKRAKMDTASAIAHIETLSVEDPLHCLMTDEEYRRTLNVTIKLIQSGEWAHNRLVCNYGRFHSPYTSLLSALRQYVTFDNQHLTNVDIANSQPLVLALLFPKPPQSSDSALLQNTEPTDPNEDPEADQTQSQTAEEEQTQRAVPYTLYKLGEETTVSTANTESNGDIQCVPNQVPNPTRNGHLPADMQRYIGDCESGMFYNNLMAHFNVPAEDRGAFKVSVFEEIYYGTGKKPTALKAEYVNRYPNVWKLIRDYKAGNYKRLSWEMQRAESRIMIDQVGYRLATEHPEVPVITIHDSILTTPENVPTVQRLMREEFGRVGLNPTLKTESTVPVM